MLICGLVLSMLVGVELLHGGFGVAETSISPSQAQVGKADYQDFLDLIRAERYNVVPVEEHGSRRPDKVNILLRHDCDGDNGLGMAYMEWLSGVRSTFYLMVDRSAAPGLISNWYDVSRTAGAWRAFQTHGHRIGLHFKSVDRALGARASRHLKPGNVTSEEKARSLEYFVRDLESIRGLFGDDGVRSVAAHGGYNNWFLDCSREWRPDYDRLSRERGFISAYRVGDEMPAERSWSYVYLSDCSNPEFSSKGVTYFREKLEAMKPGDVAQILIHPWAAYWKYWVYGDDFIPVLIPRAPVSKGSVPLAPDMVAHMRRRISPMHLQMM